MEINRADLELYQYAVRKARTAAVGNQPAPSVPADENGMHWTSPRMDPATEDQARALCLRVISAPAQCPCWGVMEVIVEIFNGGLRTWTSAPPHPLLFSYHWLNDQGELCVSEGWRSEVRPSLQPLSAQCYRMHVLAPAAPGCYTLRITIVQELVRWFAEPPLEQAEDIRVTIGSVSSGQTPPQTHYWIE